MSTSNHNATRDVNGIPVNLLKSPSTGILKDWEGETFGYVWNTDTLQWEKAQQAVLNVVGSEINVNLADVEVNQTNGTQRTKITNGTNDVDVIQCDGHYGLVSIAPGHISTANSTNTPINANATFTGASEDVTNYGVIVCTIYASHASATDGFKVQLSHDNVTWYDQDLFTIPANTLKLFTSQAAAKYYRVVYTNGTTNQTTFKLQTVLKPYYVKSSSHRIADNVSPQDDAELVKAQIVAEMPSGTITNVNATTGGNLKVSVEEFDESAIGRMIVTDGTDEADVLTGSVTGEKGLRVFIGATDPISDIPVFVDFPHHQVHEGEAHMACYLISSLGLNAVFNFRINVPAATYPHMIIEAISTSEAELNLYEGMTYTVGNGGTQKSTYNHNRNSSITPGTKIYYTVTPATDGTEIWCGLIGSGNRAGSGDRSTNEFILKAGTDYLYRVTSRSASNKILIRFNFYEDLGV